MILFAGDPHGSYEHLYPFVQENDNVALIILGDLQLSSPDELDKLAKYCDIWFIHGNHDSKTVAAFGFDLGHIGNRVICIIVLLKFKDNALQA